MAEAVHPEQWNLDMMRARFEDFRRAWQRLQAAHAAQPAHPAAALDAIRAAAVEAVVQLLAALGVRPAADDPSLLALIQDRDRTERLLDTVPQLVQDEGELRDILLAAVPAPWPDTLLGWMGWLVQAVLYRGFVEAFTAVGFPPFDVSQMGFLVLAWVAGWVLIVLHLTIQLFSSGAVVLILAFLVLTSAACTSLKYSMAERRARGSARLAAMIAEAQRTVDSLQPAAPPNMPADMPPNMPADSLANLRRAVAAFRDSCRAVLHKLVAAEDAVERRMDLIMGIDRWAPWNP